MPQDNSTQADTDKTLNTINRSLEENQAIERAKAMGLGYVNVGDLNLNPDLCTLIPKESATEGLVIPFFHSGKKIRLAVYDPELPRTKQVIESLKAQNYVPDIGLASKNGILEALHIYDKYVDDVSEDFDTDIDETNLDAYDKKIETIFQELKDGIHTVSSATLLNTLLVGAVKTKASDIHLEPEKEKLRVRYRIDGMLRDVFDVPKDKMDELIKQTKHKAKMKLNVTKRPQDGRFYFVINDREIDVRVSALPTPFGEDMVIRILDSSNKNITLKQLGIYDIAYDTLENALMKPHGMILTAGPTGSGKTTTLYALLRELNRDDTKVITIEDPIEYKLVGITQSQIQESEDYTFSSGLRSILRQDPDVVMVGEIRDLETAQTAAQASLTGHKVLSSLHTNDAVGAIDRLINMGLETFMVAPSIDTVIAQRLARTCCPHCSEDADVTDEQKTLMEKIIARLNQVLNDPVEMPAKIKKARGCDRCGNTGYSGRTGLYEVIQLTEEVRDMILKRASTVDIKHIIRKHSYSVFEAGILKVIQGITTLEEVIRVSKVGD